MREIVVGKDGAGKRLDKFLARYLAGAPKSLLYAQLRKKNITLNGKRADGGAALREGDAIQCFFSDATWEKFLHPALRAAEDGTRTAEHEKSGATAFSLVDRARACYERQPAAVRVLHEDDDLLLLDKPMGMFTQSAAAGDDNLNDWLLGYLLETGSLEVTSLAVFRPSVCHRLDRNTSGIVVCAKTLSAARETARLFKERRIGKFYLAVVHGRIKGAAVYTGRLTKDRERNRAHLVAEMTSVDLSTFGDAVADGTMDDNARTSAVRVEARVRPLSYDSAADVTLIEAELVTGKPHQLRVQLAAAGHPIVGDRKYGGKAVREDARRFGADYQLLHCARMVFPKMDAGGVLAGVCGHTFTCPAPFGASFSMGPMETTEIVETDLPGVVYPKNPCDTNAWKG